MKPIALFYLSRFDEIRAVARGLGYAIGLHGTLSRDFDLIAVPWVEDARPAADLAEAIRALIGGYIAVRESGHDGITHKPHGRMAWSIHFPYDAKAYELAGGCAYIDLSVMPRTNGGAP